MKIDLEKLWQAKVFDMGVQIDGKTWECVLEALEQSKKIIQKANKTGICYHYVTSEWLKKYFEDK